MSSSKDYRDLTGLELLTRSLDNPETGKNGMRGTINYRTVSIEEGRCVFEGTPEPRHMNMGGRVHGGWALTVLDSSMGTAVMSTLPAGKSSTTVTLEAKFMRPVAPGRLYRVTADVIKTGRMLTHVRSEMIDAENAKIVGTATGTFAIIDRT